MQEVYYTAEKDNMDISKAVDVAKQFEIAKQFWAHQVQQSVLATSKTFINPVPHIAFGWGNNVQFLQARYAAIINNPLFQGMRYTKNPAEIQQWAPLVINDLDRSQKVAATGME